MKKGSRGGVNIVILKIPDEPELRGAQIIKIYIFGDFWAKFWKVSPLRRVSCISSDISDTLG